jgi:hypothetical protein
MGERCCITIAYGTKGLASVCCINDATHTEVGGILLRGEEMLHREVLHRMFHHSGLRNE